MSNLPSQDLPTRTDVVIVGAGPVGMTIACLLGRYGIDTLVLDREMDILRHPRAIGTDNDGLRVLQHAGLARDAFELIAMPRLEMHSPFAGQILHAPLAGHINSFPTLAMFFQPDMEEAIHNTAATYDSVSLVRGMKAIDAVETADGLSVQLEDRDGATHTVGCQYLVAADGANSHFRKLIGQSFEGKDYAEDWLIVDVQGRDPEKHGPAIDHVMFGCDPARPYPYMPAPGNRERWEFKIQKGEDNDHFLKDETIRELLLPWYPDGDAQIERKAVYRFQARAVECFHKGRVMLAGDAAHVTPPFAGQGLVSGHRDALNLAWKLAWVIKGKADPAILQSYDSERRPHALATTNLARFIGSIVMPRNKLMAIIIHTLMKYAPKIPILRKRVGGVEMKPKNRFRHGLFLKRRDDTILPPGSQFPQLRLFDQQNNPVWSDDIDMGKVRLIGFGVDPADHLSDAAKQALDDLNGVSMQICYGSQVLHRATHARVYDDHDGLAMPQTAPVGWCVLLRPDQVVIADGPVETATDMVTKAQQLFTDYERNAA